MNSTAEPAAYGPVAEYISERTGLAFAVSQIQAVDEAIGRSMARLNIEDAEAFISHLTSDRGAFDDLVGEITVGETFFFRDPKSFDYIRETILPALARDRPNAEPLRIWSAGCASGEEAYSLAILLEQHGFADRARILGTDISPLGLAKAQQATYRGWSFRATTPEQMARYFRRDGDEFRLAERIRRRVEVKRLNLADNAYPSAVNGTCDMDLILCRNVLIYLDRSTIKAIARRLFGALRDGGWLITGPSDPPLSAYAPFEVIPTPAGLFYRRVAREPNPSADRVKERPASGQPESFRPVAVRSESRSSQEDDACAASDSVPSSPARSLDSPAQRRETRLAKEETKRAALIDSVKKAFAAGDYPQVLHLTEPTGPDPDLCSIHLKALANVGGLKAAEQAAAALALRHPLRPDIHYLHAAMLLGLGRHDEAIAALGRVIYLDSSLAIAHLTMGSIHRSRGDGDRARRAFRRAYSLLAAKPAEEEVPFSESDRAADLAMVAKAQIDHLEAAS